MRRTSARLYQLRQHLEKTKWRDKQAEEAYWTLILARPNTKPSITLAAFDSLLKEYYSPDLLTPLLREQNVFMSFLGKKLAQDQFRVIPIEACPKDRVYCVSEFIPEVAVARIVEDDPPIKTGVTSDAYRDNYDRIFGEEKTDEPAKDSDAIEARIRLWGWKCKTCDKIVYDPENHPCLSG